MEPSEIRKTVLVKTFTADAKRAVEEVIRIAAMPVDTSEREVWRNIGRMGWLAREAMNAIAHIEQAAAGGKDEATYEPA